MEQGIGVPQGVPGTFSTRLWVGPGGPSGAEEAFPALSPGLRSIGPGAEPAPVTGSTSWQATQSQHRAVGAWGARLPVKPCPFRAVETSEGIRAEIRA